MNTLAERATIAEIVAAYQQAAASVVTGYAAMRASFERLNLALRGPRGYGFHLEDGHGRTIQLSAQAVDEHLDRLRRQTWESLVERLEIRQMLSVQRSTELDQQLKSDTWPEVTEETVLVFVEGIRGQLGEMLEDAVAESFEWLRPHGSRHKTNSEEEIGRRVILAHKLDLGFARTCGRVYVHDKTRKHLTALENVFRSLDGKSATRHHESELVSRLNALTGNPSSWRTETEYFKARACQNGNLHLEFKRLDLLAQLNRIGSERLLRKVA